MSQDIFSSIDPAISGTALATALDGFKNAVVSGLSGTTRPAELDAGGGWIDMTNNPTSWAYKIWTGTTDVEVFTLNLATSVASVALAVEEFSVKKITADTAGAILNLVKQRIATNGQVLSGDTVGEIRFVGRASDASNPVVAYLKWDSTDDQTTSAYGGTFGFYSTPDGLAAASLHMRFINGLIETVLPLKANSLRLVPLNVATTATIVQLSAAKVLVEMTGAVATDIQGIKSDDESQVVTIHNRSSANVTLKHQNGTAAAADRMKLPSSADYVIAPEGSATLYYCTTDALWKLKSTSDRSFTGTTIETFYGLVNTWTAPAGVSIIRVNAYKKMAGLSPEFTGLNDPYGAVYSWGVNTNGQLGLGDVVPRSSPVAVLGGLTFYRTYGISGADSNFGIAVNGSAYAWGKNVSGQLGLGDVTPRSSPVAVLGGLKFAALMPRDVSVFGLSTGGVAYAWGINTDGQLGLGDVTPRSSPVAVLGGLKFAKLVPLSAAANSGSVVGITPAGLAYAWGINTAGLLGVGDVTTRSSPVAVAGGLTFADIGGGAVSTRTFFNGLTTAGAAYSWGNNTKGQLGVGDTLVRSSPVAVVGGLTFKQIVTHAKSETVFGLTGAGALYAWGENVNGQLGVGDVTNRSSPVAVLGGLTFTKVRVFKSAAFGLTADGTLYAWGLNTNGQLGVGDVTPRSSPVAVAGGLKFADVFFPDATNDSYAIFGIQQSGVMYSWGANADGSLGLGDVTPRSSPVAVLGGLAADPVEAVYSNDIAVTALTAYTITTGPGIATFGTTGLVLGAYKVEVEYLF